MKPENLKIPFSWENRRVMIRDRVWYIPERSSEKATFAFPGWHDSSIFGNDNPVSIEYCSGNGAWIAEKARTYPSINWVAVEKKFSRVKQIWSKVKNMQLKNLMVLCGEAYEATRLFFPNRSVKEVYVNFPDPWPKNRHAKNRLIQDEFAREVWRILKREGSLSFVTDDPAYSEWGINVMGSGGLFDSLLPFPFYLTERNDYGSSYFDQLWRLKGRMIRYHQFKKRNL